MKCDLVTGKQYCVTKKIKLHTKPLFEVEVTRQGTFKKETKTYYIFDDFRVRKCNVILLKEV